MQNLLRSAPCSANLTIATPRRHSNRALRLIGGVACCLSFVLPQAAPAAIVTSTIITGSDDAEEGSDGSQLLSSSDLEIGFDGSDQQSVGLRFTNLAIPQGAVIDSAFIRFTADGSHAEDDLILNIVGHDIGDAPTFSNTMNDVSGRTPTSASMSWDPDAWVDDMKYETSDLKLIVQEIVGRGDWTAGNAMAFRISVTSATGTIKRRAESYDGNPSLAPELMVQFQPVPEPSSFALLSCAALAAIGWRVRCRSRMHKNG